MPEGAMVHLYQPTPDKRPSAGSGVMGALVTNRMVRLNHGCA